MSAHPKASTRVLVIFLAWSVLARQLPIPMDTLARLFGRRRMLLKSLKITALPISAARSAWWDGRSIKRQGEVWHLWGW